MGGYVESRSKSLNRAVNMRANTLPIIYLAFANDRQADGTFLRNLGREAEQLRAALEDAEDRSLSDRNPPKHQCREHCQKVFEK